METTTLLMASRADRPEHTPQAEPVLIAVHDGEAQIVLDDGIDLRLDYDELLAALDTEHGRHSAVVGRAA